MDSTIDSKHTFRHSPRTRGFTMLEVTAGMVFLTLGLVGFSVLLVSNERAYEMSAQKTRVAHLLRSKIEEIRGTPFDEVVANYQGHTFTDPTINASGTVDILVDETDTAADAVALGYPRDLDGDGAATSTDVSGDYRLLGVKTELTWTSLNGSQAMTLYFFLSNEE